MPTNPALLKALKSRRAVSGSSAASPEPAGKPSGTSGSPPSKSAVGGPDEANRHHKEVRRHLEAGVTGSRRAAKVHLKMALHHHTQACTDL